MNLKKLTTKLTVFAPAFALVAAFSIAGLESQGETDETKVTVTASGGRVVDLSRAQRTESGSFWNP